MKIKLPIGAVKFKQKVRQYFNGGLFSIYAQGPSQVIIFNPETDLILCPEGREFYVWSPVGANIGGIMYRGCDPHPWMCSAQTQGICCGYGLTLEEAMQEEKYRIPVSPAFVGQK